MLTRKQRSFGIVAVAAVVLSGCAANPGQGGDSDVADPKADVTITVGDLPAQENAESRQAFLDAVEEFEDAHPNITVETSEVAWNPETWNAQIAGGTLPTVVKAPFTEIQALISREQIADITDAAESLDLIENVNPSLVELASDADGRVFGIPVNAYTMGLVYNRSLFTAAGLDPDSPPTTWEEVREAANAVTEKTGATGFASMTTNNQGGWQLTAMSYAFGGKIQDVDADGKATATIDNGGIEGALDFVGDVRWDDEAAGSNFLLNSNDLFNEFAGGNVGMLLMHAFAFNDIVFNRGLPLEDFGIAPLPQAPEGLGTLAGGSIGVITPKATANEKLAGLKFIEFMYLREFVDQEFAVQRAAAAAADGRPVGVPVVPLVSDEQYATYLEWIADDINVPRENYQLYLDSIGTLPLVPEPSVRAQEVYAQLDVLIQGRLTQQDFDTAAEVESATRQIDSLLSAG